MVVLSHCSCRAWSLSSLNVVLAVETWVALRVVLVASLESLYKLWALLIAEVEGLVTEVSWEESSERWNNWYCKDVVGVLSWEGWLEQDGSWETESLKVWMKELSGRLDPSTLEWVASYPGRMGMVSNPLQRSEPWTCLWESLPYLLWLVRTPVKLSSHLFFIIKFINKDLQLI